MSEERLIQLLEQINEQTHKGTKVVVFSFLSHVIKFEEAFSILAFLIMTSSLRRVSVDGSACILFLIDVFSLALQIQRRRSVLDNDS